VDKNKKNKKKNCNGLSHSAEVAALELHHFRDCEEDESSKVPQEDVCHRHQAGPLLHYGSYDHP
jgi:hypothetical protein